MKTLTLGQRLKMARATTDYTQEEVAELLDVHTFTYAKWEQDLHPPRKRHYYSDLAKIFNCSSTWLRDGTGEMGSYAPEADVSDRECRRMVGKRSELQPTLTAAQQIVLQTVTADIMSLSDEDLMAWHSRYQSNMAPQDRSRSVLPANQDLPGRTLGEKLRLAREAAGISIPGVCKYLVSFGPKRLTESIFETDPRYIEGIEADKEVPEPYMLLRLGTLYRVNWLLFQVPEQDDASKGLGKRSLLDSH